MKLLGNLFGCVKISLFKELNRRGLSIEERNALPFDKDSDENTRLRHLRIKIKVNKYSVNVEHLKRYSKDSGFNPWLAIFHSVAPRLVAM